jgi:anti-sigma28 factor (negative regulator of flagellin synthesis)
MPTHLNTVGNLHPLSGESIDTYIPAAIRSLDSGSRMIFELKQKSFVTAYVETPEDVPVALSIESEGGIEKQVALSSDQDSHHSNFLSQKGFKQRKVALIREFLDEGSYVIQAKAVTD